MVFELDIFNNLSFEDFKKDVLNDYKLACISREISILGRKEVLNGKAKFGIFGDGKELPQLAMSKIFKPGDFRSGYYRDQTFMMAIGKLTVKDFFSQLYSNNDINFEPSSSGRMMTSHFGTRLLDDKGNWKNLIKEKNSSSDISSISGQLPRLIGLAQASKIYKNLTLLEKSHKFFSKKGKEVAFGTVGNGGVSEGIFWESINAAGVLQIPMILSIWDDEYSISVSNDYQVTKNISHLLSGFKRNGFSEKGLEIFSVKGWDYENLLKTYYKAEKIARFEHVPVIIHVDELTQPLGHSTSGSHQRYKSKKRLNWEFNYDCLKIFRDWILDFKIKCDNEILKISNIDNIRKIHNESKNYVKNEQKKSWNNFITPIYIIKNSAIKLLNKTCDNVYNGKYIYNIKKEIKTLSSTLEFTKRSIFSTLRKCIYLLSLCDLTNNENKKKLINWFKKEFLNEKKNYSSCLYSSSYQSLLNIIQVNPEYDKNNFDITGSVLLKNNFDKLLETNLDVLIIGQDVGKIGDVNGSLDGLQSKYGNIRVSDTGVRESTIVGQGIGLSIRGLRPIVEIQYIDYILYALFTISDDLACLRYRTRGGQKAPVIIRTRGHRLEGIWHSGSPMGGIINFLRGVLILVPRNMTKAAGFYNSLLDCDDPAIVIECLNGYRLKEKCPSNFGLFKTPIGKIDITKLGKDITVVTYGSTWRLVNKASNLLLKLNIDIEIIDIQSLIPFDINHDIVKKSLIKTNRLVIIDEDVPGGASSYILQKILEEQKGYYKLDSIPITITAKEHRPAYGSDGDYFSKPSVEDIVYKIYNVMHEFNPNKYPLLY